MFVFMGREGVSESFEIKVPLFVPDLGEPERNAVLDCIDSGWVAMGPRCEALESAFCDQLDVAHAVTVNSCTAALHLALRSLDIGPEDEVIVPSLTFAATANSVVYCGAEPVFADIASNRDWTIAPNEIERLISPRTRAIIVMHFGGYPCDMDGVIAAAETHGIPIVEDACHGLGGTTGGTKSDKAMGTVGRIGCFSFYSNKVITTGEGGLLVTNSSEIDARCRLLRSHGMTAGAFDRMRGAMGYDIAEVGYNYRMDDIRAAIGLAQLTRLDGLVRRRRELVAIYREKLASVEGVDFPDHGRRGEPAHYILPVLLAPGVDRDKTRAYMLERGVQTSIHYPPIHRFGHYDLPMGSLPVTESVASRMVTLPLYPQLSEAQIDLVVSVLEDATKIAG